MKKYFIYNNEYISGGKYWLRSFLQSYLIYFFGIGIYLLCVTTYKRARSLGHSSIGAWCFVAYDIISVPISFLIGFESPEAMLPILAIMTIPHWYLIFKNGTPPSDIKNDTV